MALALAAFIAASAGSTLTIVSRSCAEAIAAPPPRASASARKTPTDFSMMTPPGRPRAYADRTLPAMHSGAFASPVSGQPPSPADRPGTKGEAGEGRDCDREDSADAREREPNQQGRRERGRSNVELGAHQDRRLAG